jgi:hypothetical protein
MLLVTKKRTTIFFGDVIGYRILFSDKKTIPEMILVSRKKTGRASDDKKIQLVYSSDDKKNLTGLLVRQKKTK